MHPLELFRFCPKCGSDKFEEHDEKSKKCACCGFTYYFNPSTATVAFITNEKDELLVCRRAKEPAKGTYDLPGGFLDMHETSEMGVCREVKEETGLEVIHTQYLFSLPNTYLYSGFLVHTLDLFFKCEVKSIELITAMDDVSESFWIPINEINPENFGLNSIRKGVAFFKDTYQHHIVKTDK